MPIITYRPRRIPARRFQQMLDAWLEQPLHGGLVLSRRGWPPAFLAHNAARAGVDSPRFVAGACPTRAGAGYLFLRLASIIHPYPSSIISSYSRRGEEKTASSSRDDDDDDVVERRDRFHPSRCWRDRKTFEVEVTCEARVRLPAMNKKKRRRLLASRGLISMSKGRGRSLADILLLISFRKRDPRPDPRVSSILSWRNGRCFSPGREWNGSKVSRGWRRNR